MESRGSRPVAAVEWMDLAARKGSETVREGDGERPVFYYEALKSAAA